MSKNIKQPLKSIEAYFRIIDKIFQNELNYELLYAAANSQWKLCEFFTDEFKEYIYKITLY